MKIEQIYTGCLAQGAYYITSGNEAAIIDPLREVQPYIDRAQKDGVRIKYIFETHFHADFVSGHVDLAAKTGADIVLGPTDAEIGYKAILAKDGEIFSLGNVKIEVLHTPGHTMESCCYLLYDEIGKSNSLFTGDTLFINDVGRPDLAQKISSDLTKEKLAGHLFESLRNKILPLPDDIIVYPAHGAGSACGKNMSKETTDTLGHQKKTNYALNLALNKEEFIDQVTDGLTEPPQYFPQNVLMNIHGYDSISSVLERGSQALSPQEFEDAANHTGAVILDTRSPHQFSQSFVPNSINIGIDGSFAVWVGTLIPDVKQEILIVAEEGREEEVVTRMARVGYDYCIGYLKGGIDAWKNAGKEIDRIRNISAEDLSKSTNPDIIDVRKPAEYAEGHISGASNFPLDYINDSISTIDKTRTNFIHCAGGYRSMVFASILKARGFQDVVNIEGGFKSIQETGLYTIVK
ncbi:MAG TPA: MBL fold metallo-hydrolase [Niabella sp.]|nr:MBL fold metallo-hydrolase [Niabella sp.]HOZ97990.1 MBL fold metallo-hydrolase [Niabella sp.]HQW14126.1 MBL fold metallo-hydrolase [Niabella sp.]HQX19524.1 MBL fold metallo-hydrolase [Niabella sp.]HQX40040.1 MBL fold metallo-hydrolase [Niabella sp.]